MPQPTEEADAVEDRGHRATVTPSPSRTAHSSVRATVRAWLVR